MLKSTQVIQGILYAPYIQQIKHDLVYTSFRVSSFPVAHGRGREEFKPTSLHNEYCEGTVGKKQYQRVETQYRCGYPKMPPERAKSKPSSLGYGLDMELLDLRSEVAQIEHWMGYVSGWD